MHDESDAVHHRLAPPTPRHHFDVYDVTVSGQGLKLAPVARAAVFTIQSRDIGADDVSVQVKAGSTRYAN